MIRTTITRIILLYAFTATFVACRYEPPAAEGPRPQLKSRTVWVRTDLTGKRIKQKFVLQPQVLSRCEAGAQLGPGGVVSVPASTFKTTDPVHLTMWLKEAPDELQVSLRVLDSEENEVGVARRNDVGGAKAVTLRVGEELGVGKYKLEGFWGGNLVCEKGVEVR